MPNDYTATVRDIVKIKMNNIFKTMVTTSPELANRPLTAPMVLMKQNANVQPIMDSTSGEACVGARLSYLVADNVVLPTVGTSPIAGVCDLTLGDGSSSKVQDFQLNFFSKPSMKINDKDCDNTVTFAEKIAFNQATRMALMAQALNTRIINDVEANKSATVATNLPVGVTIALGNYVIAAAGAWAGVDAADTLLTLDQLALTRGLPRNYYILSGKTLQISSQLAENKQVNDNQRSYVRLFSRTDISYDVDNLDAIIGTDVIYLIDPSVIATFFAATYPDVPTPFGDEHNTIVYRTPLMYPTNVQDGDNSLAPLQFANNGVMQNVMVDVRYQRKCDVTINTNGKPTLNHIWEYDFQGMIEFLVNEGVNTGIIRVDQA